jgi:di/tricarboxylate transporter
MMMMMMMMMMILWLFLYSRKRSNLYERYGADRAVFLEVGTEFLNIN